MTTVHEVLKFLFELAPESMKEEWDHVGLQWGHLEAPVHRVLVALDPSLVQTRKMPARVECGGTFCRGMVVTDLREYPMDAPLLTICTQVDGRRAVEKLLAAFTR